MIYSCITPRNSRNVKFTFTAKDKNDISVNCTAGVFYVRLPRLSSSCISELQRCLFTGSQGGQDKVFNCATRAFAAGRRFKDAAHDVSVLRIDQRAR